MSVSEFAGSIGGEVDRPIIRDGCEPLRAGRVDGQTQILRTAPRRPSSLHHPDIVISFQLSLYRSIGSKEQLRTIRRDHRIKIAIAAGEWRHFRFAPLSVLKAADADNVEV